MKRTVEHAPCVVRQYDTQILKDILFLERVCFPIDWQYKDAEVHYAAMLKDRSCINILLKLNGSTVGYLLARPTEKVIDELKEHDKNLGMVGDLYYLETIQILPDQQGTGGAKKLILVMIEEAKKKGVNRFSVHARIANKFNVKIRHIFEGMLNECRIVEKWAFGGGETFEYIEWTVL
jgi:GNAT superfamily N-acetyltransferase